MKHISWEGGLIDGAGLVRSEPESKKFDAVYSILIWCSVGGAFWFGLLRFFG